MNVEHICCKYTVSIQYRILCILCWPSILRLKQLNVSNLPLQWRRPAAQWTAKVGVQPTHREGQSLPSFWRMTCSPVLKFGLPSPTWTMPCCIQCSQGLPRGWRHWHNMHKKMLEELQPRGWSVEQAEPESPQRGTVRGMRQQSQGARREFCLNIRTNSFTLRIIKLWEKLWKLKIFKLDWTWLFSGLDWTRPLEEAFGIVWLWQLQ